MFRKLSAVAFGAALLVSACSSNIIDSTIPVARSLENDSELIYFTRPVLRTATSFSQNLGELSVENTKVSWQDHDETLINRRVDSDFINYLLFDDNLSFVVEEFDVQKSQRFSFDLIDIGMILAFLTMRDIFASTR